MQNSYFSVSSLFYISKETILHLYVISYLMDTRFLLTCNYSAITVVTAYCIKGTKHLSIRKLLSHIASITASKAVMDPTPMVELAMLDCFTLIQLMAPPYRVNTYSEVDYQDSIFDWN